MKTPAPATRRTHLSSRRRRRLGRTQLSPRVDAPRRGQSRPWICAFLAISLAALCTPLASAQADPFANLRRNMIDDQVKKRGVKQPGVLSALEMVPRHLFVPEPNQEHAYQDAPVPFAPGQNLSHPFVSAKMIEVLELKGHEKVLEIGTGSGYDAALLSRVAKEVYTIEIDKGLAVRAKKTLKRLGYTNVEVKSGDGYRGWPEKAPFDAILVTVSTREPPPHLYDQLKMGGRMVVAVGSLVQEMQLITKTPKGRTTTKIRLVNLGPMQGEVNRRDQD